MPASVEKISICSETGLLPRAGCPVITEYLILVMFQRSIVVSISMDILKIAMTVCRNILQKRVPIILMVRRRTIPEIIPETIPEIPLETTPGITQEIIPETIPETIPEETKVEEIVPEETKVEEIIPAVAMKEETPEETKVEIPLAAMPKNSKT